MVTSLQINPVFIPSNNVEQINGQSLQLHLPSQFHQEIGDVKQLKFGTDY